jgi:hypothetical protein
MRTALFAAAACVIAIGVAAGQANKPAPTALPDWSGVWQMIGPTVFDRASVQPQNGRAGDPGVREFPPLDRRVRGDLSQEHRAYQGRDVPRSDLGLRCSSRFPADHERA